MYMTLQLTNNLSGSALFALYGVGSIYHPATLPFNVKEILNGRSLGDKEKMLDHTFSVINTPVSTGYTATSCALSIESLLPGSVPFLHVLGVVSGLLGLGAAAITLLPESIGLARSLRLKNNIDLSKPEETLALVRERYLGDAVGKTKLERRVGKWLVQEIAEGKLPAAELAARLAVQNTKKVSAQSLGILALLVSIAAFAALIAGVGMLYLIPVYVVFGALLVAKYVIDQGIFEHNGWSLEAAALIPVPLKKMAQGISCFVSGGSSVESNALKVENALPLNDKSSS